MSGRRKGKIVFFGSALGHQHLPRLGSGGISGGESAIGALLCGNRFHCCETLGHGACPEIIRPPDPRPASGLVRPGQNFCGRKNKNYRVILRKARVTGCLRFGRAEPRATEVGGACAGSAAVHSPSACRLSNPGNLSPAAIKRRNKTQEGIHQNAFRPPSAEESDIPLI